MLDQHRIQTQRAARLQFDAGLRIHFVGVARSGPSEPWRHARFRTRSLCRRATRFCAALIARHSRLLGVHLNDGYGKRDDGLMVGAVHPIQTIELLRELKRSSYDGPIYFDTFPDLTGLDPVKECEANIASVTNMLGVLERLDNNNRLNLAIDAQDAVTSQSIVQNALFGL